MHSHHTGLEASVKELRRIVNDRIRPALAEAIAEGAKTIKEEAKERAPVDTGALRDSIKTRNFRKKLEAKVECDYPKVPPGTKPSPTQSRKYYAFALEYGTPTNDAQPFMGPAVEAKEDEVEDIIKRAMDEAVR